MRTHDAIYYGGLIAGMIVGTMLLRELGITGIMQLLGGLAMGVGAGYAAEQMYNGGQEG